MSCYDPVTTSSYSNEIHNLPQVQLSTMMETLAALQPLLAPTSSAYFNMVPTSNTTNLPSISLPLLTTPLSSLSLTSPMISPSINMNTSISPLTINTEGPSNSQLSSFAMNSLSPLPILQTGLSSGSSTGISYPQPLRDSHLSPIAPNVHPRRKSAPEGAIRIMPAPERRRYSDFSVEALLSSSSALQEQRRTSSGRKQRTIYGAKQTEVLEEAFHSQKYMVGTERELLAARLGLSEAQVRVWFQNRRSKQRKILRHEEERNAESRRS